MRRGRTTSAVYRCQFGMAETERREAREERRWRAEGVGVELCLLSHTTARY